MNETVEAVARALWELLVGGGTYDDLNDEAKDVMRGQAQAAISAHIERLMEPTPENVEQIAELIADKTGMNRAGRSEHEAAIAVLRHFAVSKGVSMAERSGLKILPEMIMTREERAALSEALNEPLTEAERSALDYYLETGKWPTLPPKAAFYAVLDEASESAPDFEIKPYRGGE